MATAQDQAVAIAGMGCRWPGGVRSPVDLWEFLNKKIDGWREFEEPHFSARGFHHPGHDRPGTISMQGGFLADEDARLFDHSFFGMAPTEVETMDPSQRKLLEVTYEALENAGETLESVSGSRTGVFVGNFTLDHLIIQSRDWDNPRRHAFTGAGTSILANRISYIFNFQGPSLTIDTACSSSMYALHLAVNAIRAGDCDSAIVASGNWIADPGAQIAFDKLGVLSASSRCHTFDARAEGYARGEGYGAIYLKNLTSAFAHQSPIRALIRGTAINSNGRTGGITRPSATGQETVIRDAYRHTGGLLLADTDYFECHGTGTQIGDQIEVAALGAVFAPERDVKNPLLIGSVKSNLGHTEGASALASIMKVVLSLEHGAIPPLYDLRTLNPDIDFEGAKVKPVTELTPWPNDIRRASINSFGVGGANGHAIIDHVKNLLPEYEAPGVFQHTSNGSHDIPNEVNHNRCDAKLSSHHPVLESPKMTATATAATRQRVLLPFSGHSEDSVKLNIEKLTDVVVKFSLADVAFTLSARHSRLAQRSFRVVDKDHVDLDLALKRQPKKASLQASRLGFIFTGQGAQWHAMGAGLFEYRVFRTTIEYLDHVLGAIPDAPSWSLCDILSGNCDATQIQAGLMSQAACTAVQIGLVDLLASWSVRPSGVAGNSSGEIAAAYASGRITAAEAILVAFCRGRVVSENKQTGAMLAVGLGAEEIAQYIQVQDQGVRVAAINSPESVTLSGELRAIEEISATLTANKIFNRTLKTGGNAYHSHHMLSLGGRYLEMLVTGLESIESLGLVGEEKRYPEVPWISSVMPEESPCNPNVSASYWRTNLESPVLFSEAVTTLCNMTNDPIHAILEIGPQPALKTPIEQILKAEGKSLPYACTLRREENNQISLLQLAGILFELNASIDLVAVNATDKAEGLGLEHGCTSIDLPPYQYTYAGLNYHESRASREYRHRSVIRHDLLGSKVVGTAKLRPQWSNILRTNDVPWLSDHSIGPDVVLPAAAYVMMATEAAARVYNDCPETLKIKGFSFHDVSFKKMLTLPTNYNGVEVLMSMELDELSTAWSPRWATFSISSVKCGTDKWSEHCTGFVKVEIDDTDLIPDIELIEMVKSSAHLRADTNDCYKKLEATGVRSGRIFQALANIQIVPHEHVAVADLSLDSVASLTSEGESKYPLHPTSLTAVIQLGLAAIYASGANEAGTAPIPVHLSQLYLANDITSGVCTAVGRGERRGSQAAYLDLQILDPNNGVILSVDSLCCTDLSADEKSPGKTFFSPSTRLVWKPDIRTMTRFQTCRMHPPPKENIERLPKWEIANKLAYFVVYSVYEKFGKLEDGPKPSGDVGHFFNWIKRTGESDHSDPMNEARQYAKKGRLLEGIEELAKEAEDIIEVEIAKLLHDNMSEILYERRTGVDVILGENLLAPLYQSGLTMTGIYPQLHWVLEGIAHSNPNLRILEIGGGTGGATRIAMKAFSGPNGTKAYKDYNFTDISAGILVFGSPAEQGYEQRYDLIIACQVLHATPDIQNTLFNCRNLLRPGGRLVLVEANQNFIVPNVVVGTFTGYWAGIPDGRIDSPYQNLDAWEASLQKAGFMGIDTALNDFPEPHNTISVILSTCSPGQETSLSASVVHLLRCEDGALDLVDEISQEFKERGVIVQISSFDKAMESTGVESRVVAFLDEEHLLADASEKSFNLLQRLAINAASFVVVTSCGIARGRNPDGASIPGLWRVLQTENPDSQYMSIDIDSENFAVPPDQVKDLARSIVNQEFSLHHALSAIDEETGWDREFCWQDGAMWVSRYVPDSGFDSQHGSGNLSIKAESVALGHHGALRASFEKWGARDSLCFKSYTELLQPLHSDFIDVQVAAVGLNQRDFDNWSNRFDCESLSSEYAGTISAVGASVKGFEVGDRVYGLGKGQFGSYTRVPAAFANKLQPGDDFIEMASIPWAYMAAVLVLDHLAHLKANQTVLIQSPGSDVGMASIRLAISKGAKVFALVDTAKQSEILQRHLAMSPSHIFLSSIMTNLRQAAQMTLKGGFDVIMSTESKLLPSFHRLLAPFGYLVDLRKANILNAQIMAPELSQKNAAYRSVDLSTIMDTDPVLTEEIMQAIDSYYHSGVIEPIPNVIVADISDFPSTTTNFSDIIGKLVITFMNPESRIQMLPSAPIVALDPSKCYILAGALDGLGQSIVGWMSDRGARNIAVLSRGDIDSSHGALYFIGMLASRRIEVNSVICDTRNMVQLSGVVHQISSLKPIGGVIFTGCPFSSSAFDETSAGQWNELVSEKYYGTKNLHEATLGFPLEFFVMTASAQPACASAKQSACMAASNFQDAFARYRRRLGLAASTIHFDQAGGVIDEKTDVAAIDSFELTKLPTLDESQVLAFLESTMLKQAADTLTTDENWPGQLEDPFSATNFYTCLDTVTMIARERNEDDFASSSAVPSCYNDARASLVKRACSDLLRNVEPTRTTSTEKSKNTIASIRSGFDAAIAKGEDERTDTAKFVENALIGAITEKLFVDTEGIDPSQSVAELGGDSLIAADLRNWSHQALAANIGVMDFLEPGESIQSQAETITNNALAQRFFHPDDDLSSTGSTHNDDQKS